MVFCRRTSTDARLVKDVENGVDLSSYSINTVKAPLPLTSNIRTQSVFTCSFSKRHTECKQDQQVPEMFISLRKYTEKNGKEAIYYQ